MLAHSSQTLKRTASVASLPTPPRTQRRRRKGRVSDSEEELPKKPRLSRVEDQEAFWLGAPTTANSSSWSSEEEDGVPPILQRRKERDAASDYASPPPSHRKVTVPRNASNGVSVKTPHSRTSLPIRDSPNNPFLDSPPASGSGGSVSVESDDDDDDDRRGDIGIHPTITYVHRGVRRTFPNPYHDPATGLPRPPNPNSLLPPEHPDYEPDLRCVRKVLFPGSSRRRRGRHAKEKKVVDSSDEEMGSPQEALLMAPGPPRRGKLEDSW